MLHHVSVGVANVEAAARFYDRALAPLGYRRVMEFLPYAVAYGEGAPEFWIQVPIDRQPSSAGNGTHIAFSAGSEDAVKAFHDAALAAGGKNEGQPGPRPEYGPDYYGAFVRDPDGNKIEAVVLAKAGVKPAGKRRAPARKTGTRKPARRPTGRPAKKKAVGARKR